MFGFKKKQSEFVSVVIVGAGSSTRMGQNKLLMEIYGVPVIEKTISVFDKIDLVCEIILVCRQEDFLVFSNICKNFEKPIKIVNGGQSRTHSTLNGINACNENTQIIAIHDAARPLVTEKIIVDAIECATENNTAIPVVPVKDTIKIVENNICKQTISRDCLFLVQTPQVFRADIIKNSTIDAVSNNITFTDDSTCVENTGQNIHTILGSYDNIKITTIEDISQAMSIIDRRGFK